MFSKKRSCMVNTSCSGYAQDFHTWLKSTFRRDPCRKLWQLPWEIPAESFGARPAGFFLRIPYEAIYERESKTSTWEHWEYQLLFCTSRKNQARRQAEKKKEKKTQETNRKHNSMGRVCQLNVCQCTVYVCMHIPHTQQNQCQHSSLPTLPAWMAA